MLLSFLTAEKIRAPDLNVSSRPIKDPNKSNTQKYFRHSNVKRYEVALLRPGYFFYFGRLVYRMRRKKNFGAVMYEEALC